MDRTGYSYDGPILPDEYVTTRPDEIPRPQPAGCRTSRLAVADRDEGPCRSSAVFHTLGASLRRGHGEGRPGRRHVSREGRAEVQRGVGTHRGRRRMCPHGRWREHRAEGRHVRRRCREDAPAVWRRERRLWRRLPGRAVLLLRHRLLRRAHTVRVLLRFHRHDVHDDGVDDQHEHDDVVVLPDLHDDDTRSTGLRRIRWALLRRLRERPRVRAGFRLRRVRLHGSASSVRLPGLRRALRRRVSHRRDLSPLQPDPERLSQRAAVRVRSVAVADIG